MFGNFLTVYEGLLHNVAELTVATLELIGIAIIIIGSIKAIVQTFARVIKKQPINIMIELGRALALALEFKMGAEIVNTVVVRELSELLILGIVIALRAILAILIHWEIKNERMEDEREAKKNEK